MKPSVAVLIFLVVAMGVSLGQPQENKQGSAGSSVSSPASSEFQTIQGGPASEGGSFRVLLPANSRVVNGNGVAGYCVSQAPHWNGTSGGNCVGSFGWARATSGTNDAGLWGGNFGVQDTAGTTGQYIQGMEIDVNVNSLHSALVNGIDITGIGKVAHPTATALAINGNAGPQTLWAYGLQISDAATRIAGVLIGARPGTGARGSQAIQLSGYDSAGNSRSAILQSSGEGDLILAPSVGRAVIPNTPGAYVLGNSSFPWRGMFIGSATSHAAQITGSFAVQRTFTLPDVESDTFTMNAAAQTLTNKHLSSPTIDTGISNTGSGFQHKRVAGCVTGADAGSTCVVTVTWNHPFDDTDYTASCTGDEIASGIPVSGGLTSKTADTIQFQTVASTSVKARWIRIDCIGVHD